MSLLRTFVSRRKLPIFPVLVFLVKSYKRVSQCSFVYECCCRQLLICLSLSISATLNRFSSVQTLSRIQLFATPWTAARQAPRSITNSHSLLNLMSIKSVMPSNHLPLCPPLLLPPSIFPSIRVFSNELVFHIRWPKYWSFRFNISPSNEYSGMISFKMDWLDLLVVQGTLKPSPTPQFKGINSSALSFLHNPTLTSIHDYWKNHSLDQMDLCW